MNEIVKHLIESAVTNVVPIAVSVLTAGFAWLGKNVFNLVSKKIHESNTKIDDYLAGLAVKWAEDTFGPNSDKGEEKREAAINYLMNNSKNKLSRSQAEVLVGAAYQSVFGNIDKLKNG